MPNTHVSANYSVCVCLHMYICIYIYVYVYLLLCNLGELCNLLGKSIRTSLCCCLLWYLPVAVLSALVVAFYCGFAFRN